MAARDSEESSCTSSTSSGWGLASSFYLSSANFFSSKKSEISYVSLNVICFLAGTVISSILELNNEGFTLWPPSLLSFVCRGDLPPRRPI